MKTIFRNAETVKGLVCYVIKICPKINHIRVIICSRTQKIDHAAKLIQWHSLIFFLLQDYLICNLLCGMLFHTGKQMFQIS